MFILRNTPEELVLSKSGRGNEVLQDTQVNVLFLKEIME